MAATNHTPVYQFNQWEEKDPVLREDFNADNLKMENALNTKTALSLGTYVGSTESGEKGSQDIVLGYRPKFVFVWRAHMATSSVKDNLAAYRAVAADGFPYGGVLEITDTGFTVSNTLTGANNIQYPCLNTQDVTYYYAVFR